jgi:YcxB-like protein
MGVVLTEMAATPPLSVTFIVTADDLVATNHVAERDGPPLVYLTGGLVALVGVVLFAVNWLVGTAIAALGVAVVGVTLVPAFRRFWLTRMAGTLLGEQRDFVFDSEGMHEEQGGIRHTTPWAMLTELRIAPTGVFLLRQSQVIQAVPARAFSSPDALDRLIQLVSSHASNVRIT